MTAPLDRCAGNEASWRKCVVFFAIALFGSIAALVALIIVVDPYDSGRFPTFMPAGTPDKGPHTVGVSRGRAPGFNGIILGNSRSAMMDAQPLSAATGYRFLQMVAVGSGPQDQIALLHWFAKHRPRVDAIIVMTDERWCLRDLAGYGLGGFPHSYYGDSDLAYLSQTLNTTIFHHLKERVLYALGLLQPSPINRTIDIERETSWEFDPSARDRTLETRPFASSPDQIVALKLLDQELAKLNTDPMLVLWMPPLYSRYLPEPGTPTAHSLEICKHAMRHWSAGRRHAAFVDFAVDNALARDPTNFLDASHVRRHVMRQIEGEIVSAVHELSRLGAEAARRE